MIQLLIPVLLLGVGGSWFGVRSCNKAREIKRQNRQLKREIVQTKQSATHSVERALKQIAKGERIDWLRDRMRDATNDLMRAAYETKFIEAMRDFHK